MKKTTITSLIISICALLAFILCFIAISEKEDFTNSILKSTVLFMIITTITNIICSILFSKKYRLTLLVPIFLTYGIFTIFQVGLASENNLASNNSYELLSLLIIIAYIVGVIFALNKQAKWASIIVIIFTALLIFTNLEIVSALIFNSEVVFATYAWIALGFVLAFTAQLIYFINPLFIKKESKQSNEENSEE